MIALVTVTISKIVGKLPTCEVDLPRQPYFAEAPGSGREPSLDLGSDTDLLDGLTVDSKKLEHGFRVLYGGFPSFFGFGIGRR